MNVADKINTIKNYFNLIKSDLSVYKSWYSFLSSFTEDDLKSEEFKNFIYEMRSDKDDNFAESLFQFIKEIIPKLTFWEENIRGYADILLSAIVEMPTNPKSIELSYSMEKLIDVSFENKEDLVIYMLNNLIDFTKNEAFFYRCFDSALIHGKNPEKTCEMIKQRKSSSQILGAYSNYMFAVLNNNILIDDKKKIVKKYFTVRNTSTQLQLVTEKLIQLSVNYGEFLINELGDALSLLIENNDRVNTKNKENLIKEVIYRYFDGIFHSKYAYDFSDNAYKVSFYEFMDKYHDIIMSWVYSRESNVHKVLFSNIIKFMIRYMSGKELFEYLFYRNPRTVSQLRILLTSMFGEGEKSRKTQFISYDYDKKIELGKNLYCNLDETIEYFYKSIQESDYDEKEKNDAMIVLGNLILFSMQGFHDSYKQQREHLDSVIAMINAKEKFPKTMNIIMNNPNTIGIYFDEWCKGNEVARSSFGYAGYIIDWVFAQHFLKDICLDNTLFKIPVSDISINYIYSIKNKEITGYSQYILILEKIHYLFNEDGSRKEENKIRERGDGLFDILDVCDSIMERTNITMKQIIDAVISSLYKIIYTIHTNDKYLNKLIDEKYPFLWKNRESEPMKTWFDTNKIKTENDFLEYIIKYNSAKQFSDTLVKINRNPFEYLVTTVTEILRSKETEILFNITVF